jgi:hypothetical protein
MRKVKASRPEVMVKKKQPMAAGRLLDASLRYFR